MKAVLVIDIPKMPTNCVGCPMTVYSKSGTSVVCRETWTGDVRPDWCPLRTLPHYFTNNEILMAGSEKKAIEMRAHNDCLDEIAGETE